MLESLHVCRILLIEVLEDHESFKFVVAAMDRPEEILEVCTMNATYQQLLK